MMIMTTMMISVNETEVSKREKGKGKLSMKSMTD
jgi:hypothetical protein